MKRNHFETVEEAMAQLLTIKIAPTPNYKIDSTLSHCHYAASETEVGILATKR